MDSKLIVVGLCVTVRKTYTYGYIAAISIQDGLERISVGVKTEGSFGWYSPEDLLPTINTGWGLGDQIMVVRDGHPLYGEIIVGSGLYPFEGVMGVSVFHKGKPYRISLDTTVATILPINYLQQKVVYEGGDVDHLVVGEAYEVVDQAEILGATMYRLGATLDQWYNHKLFKRV